MGARVRGGMRGLPPAAAVALLVAVILLPNWRLATMQGVMIPSDIFTSDLMNNSFPYRFYLGEALKNGEFPLWYPPVYGGFPLVARAESGVCFPLNILLFGIFPPYAALNLVILTTLLTAALGMFLYAREVTGSTAGAVIAGVSFAWSGFMVSHIRHLSMVGTVALLPMALFALERFCRAPVTPGIRWRPLMAFSIVFGLQILSGHIQTAYYSGILYAAYFLFRFLLPALRPEASKAPSRRVRGATPPTRRSWLPHTAGFLAGVALAAGLGAVQLIPTYELVQQSQRAGGVEFSYASAYAYDPADALTFLYPYANGDISKGTYTGTSIFWENYGYAGLIALMLAAVAVFVMRREWHVKFFALAAVAAYIVVLGPATPAFEILFRIVPGMSYFRFPTRFLFIVNAALALLAAFGTEAVLRRISSRPIASIAPLLLIGAASTDLVFFQLRQNPVVDMATWQRPPHTANVLGRDTSLFRIYSPGASEVYKRTFARARGWGGDLTPYVRQREFLQPSSNVLYGISSADGYAQLTPAYVVDLWGDQNRGGFIFKTAALSGNRFLPGPAFMNIMHISGVKYILSAWPVDHHELVLMDTAGGVFMYQNSGVLPRARLVGSYRVASSPAAGEEMLLRDEVRPDTEAILYAVPPLVPRNTGEASTATIAAYGSNEVVIRTSAPSDRLLVLADTDYPGWRAEVDGEETTIYRANLTQRAVVVPGGEHTVRFVFASPTFTLGLVLSLAAVSSMAFIFFRTGSGGRKHDDAPGHRPWGTA